MIEDKKDFNELVDLAMANSALSAMRPVVEKELLHHEIFQALDADGLLTVSATELTTGTVQLDSVNTLISPAAWIFPPQVWASSSIAWKRALEVFLI